MRHEMSDGVWIDTAKALRQWDDVRVAGKSLATGHPDVRQRLCQSASGKRFYIENRGDPARLAQLGIEPFEWVTSETARAWLTAMGHVLDVGRASDGDE